jgi:hypothetical protein
MSELFPTYLTRVCEPLCNSCCKQEGERSIHMTDVDERLTPEERKRFACVLAELHGLQHVHIACIPWDEVANLHQLHMDDGQAVYQCTRLQPQI